MELKVWEGDWIPSVEAAPDLAVVGDGADEVNGDVVGANKMTEMEELIQMSLCWERNDHHHNVDGR